MNFNYSKKLFSAMALALPLSLYAQKDNDSKAENTSQWKTLEGKIYSIKHPEDWEANTTGQMGTTLILLSALESDNDQFRENVNLIIQDIAGYDLDLDKYTKLSEEQIKTMITNSNLLESKRIKNGKGEYQKMIYLGDQGIYHLKFEQYYWVIKDKAYLLTFTAEQDKFDQFVQTGEGILDSFSLKIKK